MPDRLHRETIGLRAMRVGAMWRSLRVLGLLQVLVPHEIPTDVGARSMTKQHKKCEHPHPKEFLNCILDADHPKPIHKAVVVVRDTSGGMLNSRPDDSIIYEWTD